MRNFRHILFASAALAAAVSCSRTADIHGTLEGAPDSDVYIKLLNINRYEVLDTVKTDDSGAFSYKVKIAEGQPEFVYVFYGDTKIASLLLDRGDRVKITADTTGAFAVTGSAETDKLVSVEKDFADFSARFLSLTSELDKVKPGSEASREVSRKLSSEYVSYYRDRLRYVMSNPYSLTVIPVFFQMVAPNLPVFSQETDAIHFSNICDSLETVYPDSRYVHALRQEADRRMNIMELNMKIKNAPQMSYPEIEMPDVNGIRTRLSDMKGKVVLLHFWNSSDAAQKMFNLDVLKPVYEDYHSRGLDIYQVAVDVDKASWARIVKDQNLPWTNVCDGLGSSSPVVYSYNLQKLPVSFVISDGALVDEKVNDAASLRRLLDRLL